MSSEIVASLRSGFTPYLGNFHYRNISVITLALLAVIGFSVGGGAAFALLAALCAIAYCVVSIDWINSRPAGNETMQEISSAIQQGAAAYLSRQYRTIAVVGVVLFIAIGIGLDWATALGFAIGALLSGAAGYFGMNISVRAKFPYRAGSVPRFGCGFSSGVQGWCDNRHVCSRTRAFRRRGLLYRA